MIVRFISFLNFVSWLALQVGGPPSRSSPHVNGPKDPWPCVFFQRPLCCYLCQLVLKVRLMCNVYHKKYPDYRHILYMYRQITLSGRSNDSDTDIQNKKLNIPCTVTCQAHPVLVKSESHDCAVHFFFKFCILVSSSGWRLPSRSSPPVNRPKDPWPCVLSLAGAQVRFVGDPASLAHDKTIVGCCLLRWSRWLYGPLQVAIDNIIICSFEPNCKILKAWK